MHIFFKKLLPIIIIATIVCICSNMSYIFSEKTNIKNNDTLPSDTSPRSNKVRGYVCCFCDTDIDETILEPVYITLGFNHDVGSDSRDIVYYFSHVYCLHQGLHESMRAPIMNIYNNYAKNE